LRCRNPGYTEYLTMRDGRSGACVDLQTLSHM
jgi:hypothetical protein